MEPVLLQEGEEDKLNSKSSRQIVFFIMHTVFGLAAWAVLMAGGYMLGRSYISQGLILAFSIFIPLLAGVLINHFRQDEIAPTVWLFGLIWFLIVALWIIDMPTGPNECFQCDATDKLTRTFFSLPSPSGLIDNDGPFLATWPAAALIGYSIGAKLSLKKRKDA